MNLAKRHLASAVEARPSGEGNHRTKGLIRLTMACNERCPFCNVPMEDYPVRTAPAQQIERELQAFVDAGEQTLTVSGGEPTLLRARLVALVREARARGIPFVELQSNVVLVDRAYAAELAQAGLTSAFVSLLSHVPALHDSLAGLEGAFPRTLAGIDALLEAGVRVTLNPVVAQQTQDRIADYVDFVAERLPRVRSISLSAVQPHGRAAHNLDLLPDYAVLSDRVRQALGRARIHGIRLLNPYCGLPLCVGWDADVENSVEASEAVRGDGASVGEAGSVPGLDNRGDKRHGEVCRGCALRTRCGGAWHAYWAHRQGRGLAAPLARVEPFRGGAAASPGQVVVRSVNGPDGATLEALAAADAGTVWWHGGQLRRGDGAALRAAGCTDLALSLPLDELVRAGETLRELHAIGRANLALPDQAVLRMAVAILPGGRFSERFDAAARALQSGVDTLYFVATMDPRWSRFLELLRAEHPGRRIDVLPAPVN